ncbi:MAG: hypothetical protein JXC36_09215 [Candidatus Atribacteria bacterium]|nr:hypothetical protein [Candidatus Atribacteria bacterium]
MIGKANLNRRIFLKSTIGLSSAFMFDLLDNDNAIASNVWLKVIGRVTIIGKKIIITETILGILRAFDIDIAKSVESFVNAFKKNSYRKFVIGKGSPFYERQISKIGKSLSGFCQVGEYGYTTQRNNMNSKPIWTPSINMWAAIGQKDLEKDIDLDTYRCGYPVAVAENESKPGPHGGYTKLIQKFERGKTNIIIDHSKPEDIENIYYRNRNEQFWLSA